MATSVWHDESMVHEEISLSRIMVDFRTAPFDACCPKMVALVGKPQEFLRPLSHLELMACVAQHFAYYSLQP